MKNAYEMSEQEVVQELMLRGIEVKYKPVALVPSDTYPYQNTIKYEASIYETLQNILNRESI